MSINKKIIVKDEGAVRRSEDKGEHIDTEDMPAIDKSNAEGQKKGVKHEDHSGRKYQPDIDGPQQDSQETDEIYDDPRQSAGLPPAGKNVSDLIAHDLGRHDKD